MASWESEVRTDPRAPRETLAPTVRSDPSELLERRVNSVSPGCLDILGDRDLRVLAASTASQEQMERREPGESPERPVPEANEGQRVHVVGAVPEDPQENLVPRERQAMMDLPVGPAREDPKGLKARSVSPDPKDPTDHQGRTDCLDTQGREERRASKERLDPQDLEVWLDLRVLPERRDPAEREVTPGPPVLPANKVSLELQEKREERVTQVLWVFLGRWAPPG